MKRILALLVVLSLIIGVLMLTPFSSNAATYMNYTYNVLPDNTAQITGYRGNATRLSIPSVIDGYKVSGIGNNALYDYEGIKEIVLPNGIKSIGDKAFSGCTNLKNITIPDSVIRIGDGAFERTPWYNSKPSGVVYVNNVLYKYKGEIPLGTTITVDSATVSISKNAFNNNYGLADIVIPDSVEYIGLNAFYGTDWFENHPKGLVYAGNILYAYIGAMPADSKITIKDGTVAIVDRAFENYSKLAQISIPATVKSIGDEAFRSCTGLTSVTLPDSVEVIGDEAFYGCKNVTKVSLSSSLRHIGEYAFSACFSLTEIKIPENVVSLGVAAFSGCSKLKKAEILGDVRRIENSTFASCTALTTLKLPENLEHIGKWAFQNCTNLANVDIPKTVSYVGTVAFGDTAWLKKQPDGLVYINTVLYAYKGTMKENTVINIGDSTTCISASAFYMCDNLVGVSIPSSVKSIEDFTFLGCTALKDVVIPDTIRYIGSEAFRECHSLKEITIPQSVDSISGGAFTYCSGLEKITILNPKCSIGMYDAEGSKTIFSSVAIHGYDDSTAEMFAQSNGNTFVSLGKAPILLGDVDGDSEVSVMDATMIQMHMAMLDPDKDKATFDEATADDAKKGEEIDINVSGDADRDGVLSIMDATQIQLYLASVIPKL